ncbi:MAG: 5'-3' exonuclease H3TH domain-containing protein [Lentisphaeria bacterium]
MSENKRLVLIDAYSQIYRGFHALPRLTNDREEPTSALLSFARFLLFVDEEFDGAYGAVVFDKGPPAERLEILPSYKATRPPMPEDLEVQLPRIRQWIEAAGWPVLEKEGVEADDLLAAAAEANPDMEVHLISADKDVAQVLTLRNTTQWMPGKKAKLDRVGPHEVEDKFGVPPHLIPDYLALLGDASDNIPGVPGVGKKTAVKLIKEHGSVENILADLQQVKNDRIRQSLADSAEDLVRNKRLVTLSAELPTDCAHRQYLRRRTPDWKKLLELARDNNLKSICTAIEKKLHAERNPTLF